MSARIYNDGYYVLPLCVIPTTDDEKATTIKSGIAHDYYTTIDIEKYASEKVKKQQMKEAFVNSN